MPFMPLRIGDTFAGYRVLRLLGSGGMGEVYLVQHPRLPRQEALKVLRSDLFSDPSFRERFIREANLAAALRHPHIVGVHDRGEHNGHLWIAMDYIDGTDVGHLLEQKYPAGMPTDLVMRITTAVASALDYAHKKGLLHRDVKPANIIVAELDTDEPTVFLADFGIARPLDDTSGITTTNMTVGTVAYAAPEQLMGETMDGRADQYALAATAYHLLTGAHLFPNSNPAVVISRHLNSSPPTIADMRPDLSALDEVLSRSLSKAPNNRYERVADFSRALAGASPLGGSSEPTQQARTSRPVAGTNSRKAPASSATGEPGLTSHKRFLTAAVAGTITLLLLAITVVIWRPWQDAGETEASGAQSTSSSTLPPPAPLLSGERTTSTAPVALPDTPPTNSGCRGDLVTYRDIEHKFLGPVRIFLTLAGTGLDKVGCVATITGTGKVLPAIYIRVTSHFGFPSPASDATGNTFVTYNPGRYDGVLVLVPTSDGFADIGWDEISTASSPSYWGRLALYYAELIGPGADGLYTIRQSSNDCDPSCADGTTTYEDLRWNGTDYVAQNSSPPSPTATLPTTTDEPGVQPPTVNLEWACSDHDWRIANGAEGDRLCGAPYPFR